MRDIQTLFEILSFIFKLRRLNSWCSPHVWTTCLWICNVSVAISLSFITTVAAQMTVSPAATQSPHWSHISVYDAGKGASGLADFTQATSQWFLAHVDAMEANGLSRLLRKANPGVTLSHHQVDLTQLAGPDAALLP